ncbi:MAG: putative 2,5-diketo-D-gluconic acid reductase [Myxococcales bacterium]|nr:putative 2,5-diketo-D-gluconic acid reductase [Myxococcales bacterium]
MTTLTVREVAVPALFYGTAWKEERTAGLVTQALEAGFRAIDTANQRKHYFEAAVGEAVAGWLAAGKGTREQLFLQTKFTHVDGQDHRLPYDAGAGPAEQVAQSFASSLEHLQSSYVDSYVLHGPSLRDRLSNEDWQIWYAMCELERAGKTRLVGVSNVSLPQVLELCRDDGIKPAFVQNRCYARTGWDREIREVCRAHGIGYQGFSLLTANRRELAVPAVREMAARTGRTVPQLVFRFALQVGMLPLTGTSDRAHMDEDLQSLGFELSDEDVAAIERVAG